MAMLLQKNHAWRYEETPMGCWVMLVCFRRYWQCGCCWGRGRDLEVTMMSFLFVPGVRSIFNITEPLINTVPLRLRLGGLSLTGPKNCNAVTLGQSSQSPPPNPSSLPHWTIILLPPSPPVSLVKPYCPSAWCCSHSCHNLIIDPWMECCTGPHESLRSNHQPFRSMHIFVHSREEEKTAQITCWLP